MAQLKSIGNGKVVVGTILPNGEKVVAITDTKVSLKGDKGFRLSNHEDVLEMVGITAEAAPKKAPQPRPQPAPKVEPKPEPPKVEPVVEEDDEDEEDRLEEAEAGEVDDEEEDEPEDGDQPEMEEAEPEVSVGSYELPLRKNGKVDWHEVVVHFGGQKAFDLLKRSAKRAFYDAVGEAPTDYRDWFPLLGQDGPDYPKGPTHERDGVKRQPSVKARSVVTNARKAKVEVRRAGVVSVVSNGGDDPNMGDVLARLAKLEEINARLIETMIAHVKAS